MHHGSSIAHLWRISPVSHSVTGDRSPIRDRGKSEFESLRFLIRVVQSALADIDVPTATYVKHCK